MQTSIEKFENLYAELRKTFPVGWDNDYFAKFDVLYTYLSEILSTKGISFKTYFEQEIEDIANNAPNYNPNQLPFQASFIENDYSIIWFKFFTLCSFFQENEIAKNISPNGLITLGFKTLEEGGPIQLATIFEMLYDLDLSENIPNIIRLIDAILEKKEHEEYTPQDLLIWMEMVISEWYTPAFDEVIRKGLNHKYERTPDYFSHLSKTIERSKK